MNTMDDIESLRAQVAALANENRRLRVGDGPTFEELQAAGKIGGGSPYRFEDLLDVRLGGSVVSVPPLVFIHLPRTAGTTVSKILMKNYKVRATSYGANFFPRYFPSEFLSLVQPPDTDDDRLRPAFFKGHIDIGNDIFRYMPVRYVAITILRNPVERIVSHYRFNSTQPSVFSEAIREEGLDVCGYVDRFGSAVQQQYELLSPTSTLTGPERVNEALRTLRASVSFFGLQEDFEGFRAMLAGLLGLPDVSCKALNKLPAGAAEVTPEQKERLRQLLKHDAEFYESAKAMYQQRVDELARQRAPGPHPWCRFYA
jgi:hypothetical protein